MYIKRLLKPGACRLTNLFYKVARVTRVARVTKVTRVAMVAMVAT